MEKIASQRKDTAKSVADFKFNKKRVKVLSSKLEFPDDNEGIVYWMSRDQRVQGIHADIFLYKAIEFERHRAI